MKKYTKIFLILISLFSFLSTNYASLSASDGAVFITKGELKNSLQDFDSRLNTFEAGINSKIDSQVTSYLDRNGIWSGVEQTEIKGTDLIMHQPTKVSSAPTTRYDIYNETVAGSSEKTQCIMCQYVGKLNKTGLCYITLNDYKYPTAGVNTNRVRFDSTVNPTDDLSNNTFNLKYSFVKLPIPGEDETLDYHYKPNNPNFSTTTAELDGFRYYNSSGTQKGTYAWNSDKITTLYEITPYPSFSQFHTAQYITNSTAAATYTVWVQFNVTAYNTLYFFVSKNDLLGFLVYYQYSMHTTNMSTATRTVYMQSQLGSIIQDCIIY